MAQMAQNWFASIAYLDRMAGVWSCWMRGVENPISTFCGTATRIECMSIRRNCKLVAVPRIISLRPTDLVCAKPYRFRVVGDRSRSHTFAEKRAGGFACDV